MTIWVLMPQGRHYDSFEISKFSLDESDSPEEVVPTVKVELPLGSLVTFQLINPDANYRYECRWQWLD